MPDAPEVIKTDVVNAGAGPAGSTFARDLVPMGRQVLLSDMGAQFGPRPGQNLKNSYAFQRNMGNDPATTE